MRQLRASSLAIAALALAGTAGAQSVTPEQAKTAVSAINTAKRVSAVAGSKRPAEFRCSEVACINDTSFCPARLPWAATVSEKLINRPGSRLSDTRATNVPAPCLRTASPSATKVSKALTTVPRLTPCCLHSVVSEGRRSPKA